MSFDYTTLCTSLAGREGKRGGPRGQFGDQAMLPAVLGLVVTLAPNKVKQQLQFYFHVT